MVTAVDTLLRLLLRSLLFDYGFPLVRQTCGLINLQTYTEAMYMQWNRNIVVRFSHTELFRFTSCYSTFSSTHRREVKIVALQILTFWKIPYYAFIHQSIKKIYNKCNFNPYTGLTYSPWQVTQSTELGHECTWEPIALILISSLRI